MRYRLIITPRAEYVTPITPPTPPVPPEEEAELPFYPRVDPTAQIGDHSGIPLADGIETPVKVEFMVPPGISTITKAVVAVISAASGNLDWEVATDFGQLDGGENYNQNSDSDSDTTSVLANKITSLDISAALTGATSYDVVGLVFTRDGDDAADTIGDVVYYLGMYIE